MNRLIRAELFKLFKNKTFRVVCIIALVISIGMTIISSPLMHKTFNEVQVALAGQEMYQDLTSEPVHIGSLGVSYTPEDYFNPKASEVFSSAFGVGLFEIFAAVIVGAFLAKEYSQGTIKNVLAYGRRRSDFYLAKFIALITSGAVVLLCLTLIPTVGTTIINGWGETFKFSQVIRMAESFGAGLLAYASVVSIIMALSILIKSNGGVIGITMGVILGAGSILSLSYGKYKIFDNVFKITPYYNDQLAVSAIAAAGDIGRSALISLLTMIIFLVIGCTIFKRQDIK